MFRITPSSQVTKLITILAVVGEFPFDARGLLGSERYFNNLIYKHTKADDYALPNTDTIIHCQLFQLSGRANLKSIRFHKSGLQILKHLDLAAYQHYLETYDNHHLRTNEDRIIRNHRIAEATVMCLNAGIEARLHLIPRLTKQRHQVLSFNEPAFYISKQLKKTDPDGFNKTKYARIVGALFYQTGCYAVYNLRDALMKWKPESELKVRLDLTDICSMNTANREVKSAIFFGASYQTGLRVLQEWKESRDGRKLFTSVYQHIHFIPIDSFGVKLLQILTLPDWNECLLRLFFRHSERTFGYGEFPYDADVNGTCFLSFLDSDFARLYLFRDNIRNYPDRKWSVLCFRHQVRFLREYLGPEANLRIVRIEQVMELLKMERRELI